MIHVKINDLIFYMNSISRHKFVFLFATLWIAGVFALIKNKADFSLTPGKASQFESDFPAESNLKFNKDKYNLFVFIHPMCSCSEATLDNIDLIYSKLENENLNVTLVFTMPDIAKDQWINSKLIKRAQGRPYMIYYDNVGDEFKKFDAQTSGQSFLFSPEKTLVYAGGLTEERGHAGDFTGTDVVVELIKNKVIKPDQKYVSIDAKDQTKTQSNNNLYKRYVAAATFGCQTIDN